MKNKGKICCRSKSSLALHNFIVYWALQILQRAVLATQYFKMLSCTNKISNGCASLTSNYWSLQSSWLDCTLIRRYLRWYTWGMDMTYRHVTTLAFLYLPLSTYVYFFIMILYVVPKSSLHMCPQSSMKC